MKYAFSFLFCLFVCFCSAQQTMTHADSMAATDLFKKTPEWNKLQLHLHKIFRTVDSIAVEQQKRNDTISVFVEKLNQIKLVKTAANSEEMKDLVRIIAQRTEGIIAREDDAMAILAFLTVDALIVARQIGALEQLILKKYGFIPETSNELNQGRL